MLCQECDGVSLCGPFLGQRWTRKNKFRAALAGQIFFGGMLLHRVIQWVLETKKTSSIWIPATHHFFFQTELWHFLKEISTTSNPHSKQVLKLEFHQDLLLAISFVAFLCLFLDNKKTPSFFGRKGPSSGMLVVPYLQLLKIDRR